MERFAGGGVDDLNPQLSSNSSAGALLDASQYAFFGNEVLEEVELGGLEDEEEDILVAKFEEEEFQLEPEKVKHVLENCKEDMDFLNSWIEKGIIEHLSDVVEKSTIDFQRCTQTASKIKEEI